MPRKLKPLTEDQVAELWALFGEPPILSSEDKEAYNKIRQGYVAYYRPNHILAVRLIRELVDTEWDLVRLVRSRTRATDRKYYMQSQKESMRILDSPLWNSPDIDRAFEFLDRNDKWINTATARRNSVLQLLEYYGPPPDQMGDLPEPEDKKIPADDIKQISAPPVVPTESIDDDVTAQNHSQPVERPTE